jgi:ankyrin repeat protein
LNVAASEGNLRAVKYLMTHGANPLHKDKRNNDALADAKRENRSEVVAYLKSVIEEKKA